MSNIRVMPPPSGSNTHTVNGRTYTCAVGAVLDVPDFDAAVLTSNGWTAVGTGAVGATAARPANPKKGESFTDTTLGYTVHFDGKTWRNVAGVAV